MTSHRIKNVAYWLRMVFITPIIILLVLIGAVTLLAEALIFFVTTLTAGAIVASIGYLISVIGPK